MPTISAGDLTKLQGNNHATHLRMSVLRPAVLLEATVNNASISRSARTIAYDNGTGSFSTITAGQTLLVGTTAGGDDLGKVRIKSITGTAASGTITVAQNSIVWDSIAWTDVYLTVIRFFEFWPILPRIDDNEVFYKDYDIPYSGQNDTPPPVPIMGYHRAAMLGDAGVVTFTLDGSASYSPKRYVTISSYLWACDSGTIDSATSATTSIRFSTAGQYFISLTVTDSNGISKASWRVLFVHSNTEYDENYPITDFTLDSPPAWDGNGWAMRATLNDRYAGTINAIRDGALILLWQDSYYDDVRGNISFTEEILFAGYIRRRSAGRSFNHGNISIEATTINGLMQNTTMWSVSLSRSNGTPATWYEIASDYDYVYSQLHHYINWHSTLIEIADVYLPDDFFGQRKYVDFEQGSIAQAIESAGNTYGCNAPLRVDKAGRVWLEREAQMLNTAGRAALTVVAPLTDSDWAGELVIQRDAEPKIAYTHMSGFDDETPLSYKSHDDAPMWQGGMQQIERQYLEGGVDAASRSGRYQATANNPYTDIRAEFAGNYAGVIEPALPEWWTLTINPTENPLGDSWDAANIICRSAQMTWDAAAGRLGISATFEREATGPDGIADDFPGNIPDAGGEDEPILTGGILTCWPSTQGVYVRNPDGGTWAGPLIDTDPAVWIEADPFWQVKAGTADYREAIIWRGQLGSVDVIDGLDALLWVPLTSNMGTPPNPWADAPPPAVANITFMAIAGSYAAQDTFYVLGTWQNGASAWRSWLLFTNSNGVNWTWVSLL